MSEMADNTPAQIAYLQAQADAWEEERTWPIYEVTLTGDAVEYAPRADERYWQFDESEEAWVPKPADELPDDASIHPESGHVVREAYCIVQCHARSEDHAKMLAMRDNPQYHTVVSVEVLGE